MNKYQSIVLICLTLTLSCAKKDVPQVSYAAEMRSFVIEISEAAKSVNPNFLIIPQNGAPLVTNSREQDGDLALAYLAAIDGQGQEDLYFGYDRDDKATPADVTVYLNYYLNLLEENGVEVMAIDYCSDPSKITESYAKNEAQHYISFAADERNLTSIPDYSVNVYNENDADVTVLNEAKNFLYLINPTEKFATKTTFIEGLKETNYDLVLMDRDFNDERFTSAEIEALKWKANGGRRLVIAYMSIGEAEDYRSYWKKKWEKYKTSPEWLYKENNQWRGNYKVFYWMETWKSIIYGNEEAYLTTLLDVGFDGVYLDIIDGYEYYEEM